MVRLTKMTSACSDPISKFLSKLMGSGNIGAQSVYGVSRMGYKSWVGLHGEGVSEKYTDPCSRNISRAGMDLHKTNIH